MSEIEEGYLFVVRVEVTGTATYQPPQETCCQTALVGKM